MADGHGGYRAPAHPAPAGTSLPGSLSRRTDGGVADMIAPGGPYGSRQDMQQIQSGAKMLPDVPEVQAPQIDPSQLTPIDAPTNRPDEPVTAGVQEALASQQQQSAQVDAQTQQRLRNALPTLLWAASSPRASEDLRGFVRQVQAMTTQAGQPNG